MAHNLALTKEGLPCYVENAKEERAWHGLGEIYDRPLTVIEAIDGAKAGFEVGLQPVIAASPRIETMLDGNFALDGEDTRVIDGKQFVSIDMLKSLIINGKKATMRYDYDEPLAVVSDQYGVVQYRKAFEFVDMLTTGKLGGSVPTIETAGLLGVNGSRLFITAKFPEPIRIAGKDDVIDQYLVFTTSHDGSGAVTVLCTNVRVVCNNTLNLALGRNTGKLTFKHTSRVNERIDLLNKHNAEMAYKTLGLYNSYKEFFEAELEAMAKVRLSDKEQEKIIAEAVFSPDVWKVYSKNGFNLNSEDISSKSRNLVENILETTETGIGQAMLEGGTGLKLVNGISCYYQNVANWSDKEKKFNAIMDGSVNKKLQMVHDLVMRKIA